MSLDFSLKKNTVNIFIFLGFLGFFVAGCDQRALSDTPTPVFDGHLTPYLTATPSPTPDSVSSESLNSPKPTDIPAPTPTPLVYTVVENDTLTGIAFRHSVELEDLIAANPGLDPNFLTIGLTLTVPIEGAISTTLPTPTPVAISMQPPRCYPMSNASLQCMVVVENDQSFAVENVVVLISLHPSDTEGTKSKTAIAPLNIVPSDRKAAVAVTFDTPFPQNYLPQASLLSVIPISVDDQRYLLTDLQLKEIAISSDGDLATVTGSISLLPDQPEATVVWASAFAYDAQNNIVGIRKWSADDSLLAGNQIEFNFTVYSLGSSIEYVEVLTETRP